MLQNLSPTPALEQLSQRLSNDIVQLHEQGLYKHETPISSQQQAAITTDSKPQIRIRIQANVKHSKVNDIVRLGIHKTLTGCLQWVLGGLPFKISDYRLVAIESIRIPFGDM